MIKIGIECENIEDPKSRWGVGQLTLNLLREYSEDQELQKQFKFYLYFKKQIPDDDFLKNPIFIKRVSGFSSFNIFYHIAMPIRAMWDRLDWMFFPAYMLPPLYLGRSIVTLTEDVYYEYKSGTLPFRYRLAYGLFTNWAALKATKILAISETSRGEVSKLYKIKSDRVFTSYLGVNFPKATDYLLPTTNYILYIGQAFPRRHLKETILAFKTIASEFPNLKLTTVGKDKYPTAIIDNLVKDTNRELGEERITYYDYIEKRQDIEKLYAGAKALIYVSEKEAFGLPPMEALSFGTPPIIADNELGHELFNDYAFYVKGFSPDEIASSIRQALTDHEKIEKIKTIGPEFVKKYSWKNFANKFFENVKN